MATSLRRYKNYFSGEQAMFVQELCNQLDEIGAKVGITRPKTLIDTPLPQPQSSPTISSPYTPSPATFNVVGQDGKFTIYIQNPQSSIAISANLLGRWAMAGLNTQNIPIFHNLQSCTTVDFDVAHGLVDYGDSQQLVHHYQNPNVTLFWRLRSSYDGRNWNKWQIYGDSAIACGPIGVYSGLLRTAALVPIDASYQPTTQPLTAATGGTANHATISVASFQVQYPFGVVSYNSGSVTPLNDNTLYYVYCSDPTYSGGAVAYIATINSPDLTKSDSLVYLGRITTPVFGGGGTNGMGGGNGPCFTGNTRIITKDGIKRIAEIEKGDEILTQRGWRKVARVIVHEYDGPVHGMGFGEYVTPIHNFWFERTWERAQKIFRTHREFQGRVFNLEVEGDGSDEEQCYTLANGWIAHNSLDKL